MDVNKQSQQAGEGSQLVQAGTIVINQGVSEERVRKRVRGTNREWMLVSVHTEPSIRWAVKRIHQR